MIEFNNVARFDAGTNEQYHAGEGVSNSQISDFIADPALFHGRYNTLEIERREATPQMLLGTALHEMVLEGGLQSLMLVEPGETTFSADEYDKLAAKFATMVRIPDSVLNESGHCRGKAYTDWAKSFKGRTLTKSVDYDDIESKLRNGIIVPEGTDVVSPEMMDTLAEMMDALKGHAAANRLLFGDGESEVPIQGRHSGTDILTRCKLDRFSETTMGGFVADLKTVRDASPRGFASSVASFGYHRQRVLYGSLVESLVGRVVPFYFVCIEKAKPYRVEVYELDPEWIDKGVDELEKAFRDMHRCSIADCWKHEHYGDVLTLPMPKYLNYQSEWEAS